MDGRGQLSGIRLGARRVTVCAADLGGGAAGAPRGPGGAPEQGAIAPRDVEGDTPPRELGRILRSAPADDREGGLEAVQQLREVARSRPVVGQEQQVHRARLEPGGPTATVEDRPQPLSLRVAAEDHSEGAPTWRAPAEVEEGRALVRVRHPRGDRRHAHWGALVPVEGAVEPDDPAGVPRHAGGIPAPRPVVPLRFPAARDPGEGGSVVRVVMGDPDPDRPRIQGSEQRADALVAHGESIPGSRVKDPCGGAGCPGHDRGSITHVEDVDLQGGGDRSWGAGPEGRAWPWEEQRAETRGAEGRESPAGSSSRMEAGDAQQGAGEEHERRGSLGEGKGGPGESVDPLEPGDEARGPPAREVVEPFEGEQESEPSGGDQQCHRGGGDGRGEEAGRAPFPEDAPHHRQGREGGDGPGGERRPAQESEPLHQGDQQRWPWPARGADRGEPAGAPWFAGGGAAEGTGDGARREHEGCGREVGELGARPGRREGIEAELDEGGDAHEVEDGGSAPQASGDEREAEPDGGPRRGRAAARERDEGHHHGCGQQRSPRTGRPSGRGGPLPKEGRDRPGEREQEEDGEQAHVEAREGQQVPGARPGEEVGELGREPAPVPEDEGGEQARRGGVRVSQTGTDPSPSEAVDRASICRRWGWTPRSPDHLIGPRTQAADSRSHRPVQAPGPAGSPRPAVHGDEVTGGERAAGDDQQPGLGAEAPGLRAVPAVRGTP